jgi:uncharacterized protein
MKREILNDLHSWKKAKHRKPLLLLGARQVGKTWILKEFGSSAFPSIHVVDFSEKNKRLSGIFQESSDPEQILKDLNIFLEKRIDTTTDLVVFDEIQDEPAALKSLKYFSEKKTELHLACAGSLLGVGLLDESFPVGKVDYLNMYPLSFQEFLNASASEILIEEYEASIQTGKTTRILHDKLMECLRNYWITGGLPAAVVEFLDYKDDRYTAFSKVRNVQQNLIKDYQNDFGKHAGKVNAHHIRMVFENIPLQLASNIDSSVRKYIFKDIIPGRKGFGVVEGPISWLEHAGLIYKVPICSRAGIPLKAFTKSNFFKLQLLDIGLLGAMLELSPKTILENNYGTAKGFFIESYVLNELKKTMKTGIYSWSERNSEIEFLINIDDRIIPIEVKAGTRTKAKSLAQYLMKYEPDLAVKLMNTPLSPKGDRPVWKIPLYYAGTLNELVSGLS